MNRFFHRQQTTLRSGTYKLLGALSLLLSSLGLAGPVLAQTCTAVGNAPAAQGSWSIAAESSSLANGSIVASLGAAATYSVSHYSAATFGAVFSTQGKVDSNSHGAVPLPDMPGLGVRARWMSYNASSTLTPSAQWPIGFAFSNTTNYGVLLSAQSAAPASYTVSTRFIIDLVVIDADVYRGGKLSYNGGVLVIVDHSLQSGSQIPVQCRNGSFNLMDLLLTGSAPPTLPEPYRPTCRFDTSTLNQRVKLDDVTTDDIAAAGSPRSAGSIGEKTFNLRATQCEAGSRFNVYFTDANNVSSTADYLGSAVDSRSLVGMRLYAGSSTTPVRFGPAPVGNAVPANIAVQAGPTTANQALNLPFTVQHVRMPGITTGDLSPGLMASEATVTIVYP